MRIATLTKCYLNPDTCKECGGKCCKAMPGAYHPEDVDKPIIATIAAKLSAGEWAIDWWEGPGNNYFLRPATTNGRPIRDPSWGGTCAYLTETGCRLSPKRRPFNCRMIEPKRNHFDCIYHAKYGRESGKYDAVLAWKSRQHILMRAMDLAERGGCDERHVSA